jgi:hypothetical protein
MAKAGSDIEQGSGGAVPAQPALSPSATEPCGLRPSGDGQARGHTPTPWEALASFDDEPGIPIIGLRLDDEGNALHTPTNGLVAVACQLPTEIDAGDYSRAEANAAFIVKAVNSHDDRALLIRAFCNFQVRWEPWDAERGEACVNGICFATRLDTDGVPIVTDALRAALASAEAGNG